MADQQPYSYQALATQQGGYQPQQGGNPPQQGGYCPQQGSYTPQQGRYQQQEVAPSAPPDDEMNDGKVLRYSVLGLTPMMKRENPFE